MSGLFWEQDKQPNLCEAASGFTFSTINLLVAIPMFLVDVVVVCLTSFCSLLCSVLAPVLDLLLQGVTSVGELLGVEGAPSNLSLVLGALAGAVLVGACRDLLPGRAGGSWLQVGSRILTLSNTFTWTCTFLALQAGVKF